MNLDIRSRLAYNWRPCDVSDVYESCGDCEHNINVVIGRRLPQTYKTKISIRPTQNLQINPSLYQNRDRNKRIISITGCTTISDGQNIPEGCRYMMPSEDIGHRPPAIDSGTDNGSQRTYVDLLNGNRGTVKKSSNQAKSGTEQLVYTHVICVQRMFNSKTSCSAAAGGRDDVVAFSSLLISYLFSFKY